MAKQTFTTGQVLTAAQMTSLQETAMGGGSPSTKTASYVLVAADAGTVIQMNAAGSTTITVNTSLFSAGDSVQIQNIGAGTCTITPGTATVNTAGSLALSQWEGGFLYFTSASSAIFFDVVQSSGMTNPMTTTGDTIYSSSGSTPARLGIGSTGQVLTVAGGVPSWATPASAGGMTLLSTTNLSGASISLTSISQSYKELVIYLKDFYSSSATNVPISVNNGTNVASRLFLGGRSLNYSVIDYADTANLNWIAVQSNTQNNNFMEIRFPDYSNTDTMKIVKSYTGFYNTDPYKSLNFAIGLITTTTAISQISIATTAGTWSAGTCELYGVK